MSANDAALQDKVIAFPRAQVEKCLQDELIHAVTSLAEHHNLIMPSSTKEALSFEVEVDSMTCVNVLNSVQAIVGYNLKDGFIQAGGYGSIQSAIKDILPKIESDWNKKHGAKNANK